MIKNSLYNQKLINYDYKAAFEAYYFIEWNSYSMNKQHFHDQVEIMYMIHGECVIIVDSQEIKMSDGNFILIDAGVSHALIMEENTKCKMLNIEFGFKKCDEKLGSIKVLADNVYSVREMLTSQEKFYYLQDSEDIFIYLKNIVKELSVDSKENEFALQLLFLDIFIRVSKIVHNTKKQAYNTNEHVSKALTFIHSNFDNDIRVSDISDYLKINENYLQRIFKTYTGKTILEYINDLRIDKAKMLLSSTNIPIIEISNYLGINSRQYFSFLFKQKVSLSPAQFRKVNSKLINQVSNFTKI